MLRAPSPSRPGSLGPSLRLTLLGTMLVVGIAGAATPPAAPAPVPSGPPAPFTPPPAPPAGSHTVVIAIDGPIDLGLAPFVERILETAASGDTVIFQINTFGGRIDAAVQIRDAILKSKAYTVAFVDKRAISAGALIALANDAIVMASGGTMGAATPVEIEGGKMQPVEQKVVSYMRKEMKATAEARGRRGDIAEAMVDASVEIPDLDGKDTTLTLTTSEALKFGFASFSVDTLPEVCQRLGRPLPSTDKPSLNWAERAARFLSDPTVSSLLMSLGMLGILVELYAPGHIISGLLGGTCLLLFFFGHYVVHLAGWGEILLFVGGALAVAVEVFFWPGHGALAAVGLIGIFVSLALAMVNLRVPWDVSMALGWVTHSLARVFASMFATIALMALATRWLPETRLGRRFILSAAITDTAGPPAPNAAPAGLHNMLIGMTGIAETTLRPAGKANLGGKRFDVVTEGDYIDVETPIVVIAVEGTRVVVRKHSPS